MSSARRLALEGRDVLDAMEGVVYATDLNGLITFVARANWDHFAKINNGGDISPDVVIGRPLFDFIAGKDVVDAYRRLHSDLIAGVRASAAFSYRCDGPCVERLMRMAIGPLKRGHKVVGILYQSQLLEERVRPPAHLWLELADRAAPVTSLVAFCSACARVALPRQIKRRARPVWISVGEYIDEGGPWPAAPLHTICADCAASMLG